MKGGTRESCEYTANLHMVSTVIDGKKIMKSLFGLLFNRLLADSLKADKQEHGNTPISCTM